MASYMPEPLFGPKLARVVALADRVNAEFRPDLLTADTARRVAKAMPDTHPSGDQITAALRYATAEVADVAPVAEETPEQRRGRIWGQNLGNRLRAGADPAHLLSMTRLYAPASELPRLLREHFPEAHAADEAHAAEVKRDKARGLAAAVAAMAAHLAAPESPAGVKAGKGAQEARQAPAPEPKRQPLDPHAPLPPMSWQDMKQQLARLEIEAASNDPPPNAAARIARLRQILGETEPAAPPPETQPAERSARQWEPVHA